MPGEALTDAEPFLDRLAVEMACVDLAERLEDFVKSMKSGWLGGHGGAPALLHVRERSGIMACPGVVLAGVNHA